MKRRDLIALICGSTVARGTVAWAQTTEKRRRENLPRFDFPNPNSTAS